MTENKRTKPKGAGKRKQTLALKATGLDPEVFNQEWDRLPDSVKGKLASKELADLILRFAELSEALKNSERTGKKQGNNRGKTGWLPSLWKARNARQYARSKTAKQPVKGLWQPLREDFSASGGVRTGIEFLKATGAFLKTLALWRKP